MTDPDLEIRGGGSGHPDPEIRGEQSTKNFFRPFGPPFGLKIRGGAGPPGPSHRSATGVRRGRKARRKGCLLPFHSILKTMPFASINCVDCFTF